MSMKIGVDTLKWNKESLRRLYEKGYKDGQKIAAKSATTTSSTGGLL